MIEKLKKIAEEEIGKLPQEAQEAIRSFGWIEILEGIGSKYLLDEGEINDFQIETVLILTNLENINSYTRNIENNVGTSKEEAAKIAHEVAEKIFNPLYDIIQNNIKKNIINKKPDIEQNLNFILSGGDYSAFSGEKEKGKYLDLPTAQPPEIKS